jgi:hypothetical protein
MCKLLIRLMVNDRRGIVFAQVSRVQSVVED